MELGEDQGKFDPAPHPALEAAAVAYAEQKRPGQACVAKWVGKDDKYAYLALGCARFEETLGQVKIAQGDTNFLATRMRYSGDSVSSMEQPRLSSYDNGMRRLIPREVAEQLVNTRSQPEFLRLGLARMSQRSGN